MTSTKLVKLAWTRESEALLLELIRNYRSVWDPKQEDYHKIKLRQEVFSHIARAIGQRFPELQQLTGEQVRLKFKNIRTYFLNLHRKGQKAQSSCTGQPTQKWPLFDVAMFLADSNIDTSGTTSSSVLPNSEQQSSELLKLVPTLNLTSVGTLAEVERSVLSTPEPGVGMRESVSSEVSSPLDTSSVSIAEDDDLNTSGVSVRRLAMKKRKRASSDSSGVDSCVDSLRSYIEKKTAVSDMASSIGSIVEAAVDRLPYNKQLLLIQKIVQVIVEVNDVKLENM